MLRRVAYGLLAALLLAACTPGGPVPREPAPPPVLPPGINLMQTSLGTLLTDARGMTLYYFDEDQPNISNCNGPCAQAWPPLFATGAVPVGNFTVITRSDGSRQWAYQGRPLYGWAGDRAPGDTTGNGFNFVWHVASI